MGFLNSFFEFMTNSLPGGIIDNVMGHGGDGIPFSSAESYVPQDGGQQKTDVHINAESLELNAATVNVNQMAEAANDNSAAAQAEAQQEAAFNAAMREQDQGLTQS